MGVVPSLGLLLFTGAVTLGLDRTPSVCHAARGVHVIQTARLACRRAALGCMMVRVNVPSMKGGCCWWMVRRVVGEKGRAVGVCAVSLQVSVALASDVGGGVYGPGVCACS